MMKNQGRSLGVWSAILILVGLFVLQVILAIFAYIAGFRLENGDPVTIAGITILSCGIIFSILMARMKISYKDLFHPSENSVSSMFILLALPIAVTMAGAIIWVSEITTWLMSYYPLSEEDMHMFTRLMSGNFASVVTVCIMAPFIEEMLFRGLILRGFLQKYSVTKAILFSAILFALYHGNIYQMPVAMVLGIFSGWLYVRTRSLWPCILAHGSYNSFAMLFSLSTQDGIEAQTTETVFFPTWLVIISVAISIAGISALRRILIVDDRQNR